MPKETKKEPTETRRPVSWKCPNCSQVLYHAQMELQPKVCTSCGESDLEPVYAE